MRLRIDFDCAPGDLVAFTAAVRDLQLAYGHEYQIQVSTNQHHVFERNPYLHRGPMRADRVARVDYLPWVARSQAGRQLHFLAAYHEILGEQLGIPIPLTRPNPDLYLSPEYESRPPVSGRYWVVLAGGKTDITVKHWYFHRYRAVVGALRDYGFSVVQTGKETDVHPPLPNVLNLVGWGGLAELFWLVRHAEGVICPITCAMHVAAAFDKPCVVIAGGREERWWEAYTNEGQFPTSWPVKVPHRYLDTIGQLDCCATSGCWKQKTTGGPQDKQCLKVVNHLQQQMAACMDRIDVGRVVDAVLSYYGPGGLPAIDPADQHLRFLAE
jgi:hypothetical protein